MKISICLCTYQGEDYLTKQLKSYVAQTVLPDELIVCDDGSTDGTLKILRDFAQRAPFLVKIHRNENTLGPSNNFMNCMRNASGDVVLLSDQDDIWSPQKIEVFKNVFSRDSEVKFAYSDAELIDYKGNNIAPSFLAVKKINENRRQYESLSKFLFFNHGFVNGFLLGLRKEFIRQMFQFIDEKKYTMQFGHDHFIAVMAAHLYQKEQIVGINSPLVKYRQHEAQALGAAQTDNKQSAIERLRTKQKNKSTHVSEHLIYLKKYRNILSLQGAEPDLLIFANNMIAFYEKRMLLTEQPLLNKLTNVFKHTVAGTYSAYSANSFKEIARDLL